MRSECGRLLAPALAATVLAIVAGTAFASVQPMLEPERVELSLRGAGPMPDAMAMRRLVLGAASLHGWQAVGEAPGQLTLQVASKERGATIDVLYDAAGYRIRYRDSVAMDHAVDGGRTVIHPRYNKWVTDLSNEIRRGARDGLPQRRGPAEGSAAAPAATMASTASR
jgi:hypothetical protein